MKVISSNQFDPIEFLEALPSGVTFEILLLDEEENDFIFSDLKLSAKELLEMIKIAENFPESFITVFIEADDSQIKKYNSGFIGKIDLIAVPLWAWWIHRLFIN